MSLFNRSKPDELNQIIYDLLFNKPKLSRNEIAHFCEHDGICINFTRARATWHALAPCALKPWWLFLQPLKRNLQQNLQHQKHNKKQNKKNKITTNAAHQAEKTEVTE